MGEMNIIGYHIDCDGYTYVFISQGVVNLEKIEPPETDYTLQDPWVYCVSLSVARNPRLLRHQISFSAEDTSYDAVNHEKFYSKIARQARKIHHISKSERSNIRIKALKLAIKSAAISHMKKYNLKPYELISALRDLPNEMEVELVMNS